MKQFVVILLLVSGSFVHVHAQSFLESLRKKEQGRGTVTVIQNAGIDELVNNAKLSKTPNTPAVKPVEEKKTVGKTAADTRETAGRNTSVTQSAGINKSDNAADSPNVSHGKKVMTNTHKVVGYRIQAYSGGNSREDRQKAERISSAIKSRFPEMPVYVHFYSPRWICRVGNFRTYEDAVKMLKEIKGMGYTQACIVKGKINVRY
ncbi:SPOR domain-containing protein [Prevotella sp. PCHR]|uniref:SPOR domain-containing protein n=1 Tax=Xylanibacter caecicola TaxID=2736294 RepID=A0ABX2B5C0_9BACT|nr:SPOR domain-containing protein [Xylanibacter caecicola]NPE25294.1 SPOR domain-containing protein [Xylanibacter caecicola]